MGNLEELNLISIIHAAKDYSKVVPINDVEQVALPLVFLDKLFFHVISIA